MMQRITELVVSLGAVAGVLGSWNWYAYQGETGLAVGLCVAGLGLLAVRRDLELSQH